jgi:hypothetical protein
LLKINASGFNVGQRGRVFSKLDAHLKPTPDTSAYELSENSSKAFRLQPWYEKAGEQRTVDVTSASERIYDTLMPDIAECLRKDGDEICYISDISDMFESPADVKSGARYGAIFFDMSPEYPPVPVSGTIINDSWSSAYPFEPRYSNILRQLKFKKEVIVETAASNIWTSTHTVSSTHAVRLSEFLLGRISKSASEQGNFDFMCDVDLNTNTTASMSTDDLAKVLFGFGDVNTMSSSVYNGQTYKFGHNHQPHFRQSDSYTVGGTVPSSYSFGPVIRGWKHGVYSGLPSYSKAVFRRNKFGQLRDMLEQRVFTKFYQAISNEENPTVGALEAAVQVKFVDSAGKITPPENTWSQNLSFEVTSSMPYFDGIARNRSTISNNIINQGVFNISSDSSDNIVI